MTTVASPSAAQWLFTVIRRSAKYHPSDRSGVVAPLQKTSPRVPGILKCFSISGSELREADSRSWARTVALWVKPRFLIPYKEHALKPSLSSALWKFPEPAASSSSGSPCASTSLPAAPASNNLASIFGNRKLANHTLSFLQSSDRARLAQVSTTMARAVRENPTHAMNESLHKSFRAGGQRLTELLPTIQNRSIGRNSHTGAPRGRFEALLGNEKLADNVMSFLSVRDMDNLSQVSRTAHRAVNANPRYPNIPFAVTAWKRDGKQEGQHMTMRFGPADMGRSMDLRQVSTARPQTFTSVNLLSGKATTLPFYDLAFGEHTPKEEHDRMCARRWKTEATSNRRYDTAVKMEGRMNRMEAQLTLGAYERGRTEGVFHLFEEAQTQDRRTM